MVLDDDARAQGEGQAVSLSVGFFWEGDGRSGVEISYSNDPSYVLWSCFSAYYANEEIIMKRRKKEISGSELRMPPPIRGQ